MSVEVASGSSLAEAINASLLPKLVETGWASDVSEAIPMAEYIVLMLVNGKTPDQLSEELPNLIGSESGDPDVINFVSWLFSEVERQETAKPSVAWVAPPNDDDEMVVDVYGSPATPSIHA